MEGLPSHKPSGQDLLQYTNLDPANMFPDTNHSFPSHGLPHPSVLQPLPSMPQYSSFTPTVPLPDLMPLPQEDELRQDKAAIYNHALFPLLSLVFEKCELATCAPRVAGAGVSSSESFTEDIDVFCKGVLSKSDSSVFTDNPELDNIMIESTQVLRYHLLELEKVQDLCDNFCSRYISCLKGKMPIDLGMEETDGDSPTGAKSSSSGKSIKTETFDRVLTDYSHIQRPSSTQSVGGSQSDEPRPRSRNTPTSSAHTSGNMPEALSETGESLDNSVGSAECTDGEEEATAESKSAKKQPKRGIFPKGATNIMRAWLFQHLSHPYPSEDQKKQLAQETGLTILQVNNWFINARRRIVQPMIDQSNRGGNSQLMNEMRPKSTESITYPTPSPVYPTYSTDPGMGYLDNQHMQLGRLQTMTGSEVYDPMKGAYSHMTDTTPRFDMFGLQGVPRAEMYGHPMAGTYAHAQISPYSPSVYPPQMMLPGQPHHLMGLNPNPGSE